MLLLYQLKTSKYKTLGQARQEQTVAEEAELVGQLHSLIVSMEGWRGEEEREEVGLLFTHF